MKVLIATDKFKGLLSAEQAIKAISIGVNNAAPSLKLTLHPLVDAGEGSLKILADHGKLQKKKINTVDPLGREISASYYVSEKNEAFIEIASASGLLLLEEPEHNPNETSSFGTGLLIADALKYGASKVYLFLGGSATNDGGMGIANALGFNFYNDNNHKVAPLGKNLLHVKHIRKPEKYLFKNCELILLCDVDNPFCGKEGAACIYAPQKGADQQMVNQLNEGLENFAKVIKEEFGQSIALIKGGGAAEGIAGGGSRNAQCPY